MSDYNRDQEIAGSTPVPVNANWREFLVKAYSNTPVIWTLKMILCSILFHIDELSNLHSHIHYIYTKLLCADFEDNLRPVEGDRGDFLKTGVIRTYRSFGHPS